MRRNWLEWAILAVSVVVVASLVVYLLVSGLTASGPPAIRLEVAATEAEAGPSGGWLVPLVVRNEGGEAAVSIVVEGSAVVGGEVESSQLTVDVLAADSEVELTLGFSGPPDGEIQSRVVGFGAP